MKQTGLCIVTLLGGALMGAAIAMLVTPKTGRQMRDHIRAFATEIIARGLNGKKICVIGKHTYPLIQSYYATMAVGSVWVPLDRDWAKEDLLDTVRSGECDFLMCDVDIAEKGQFINGENIMIDGGRNAMQRIKQ